MEEITAMFHLFIGHLKLFQPFLWFSMGGAAAGLLLCMWMCRNISFNSRRLNVLSVFLEMDLLLSMGLSSIYLKFMLIISTLVCFRPFPLSHYLLLFLLSILLMVMLLKWDKILLDAVLNGFLAIGMGVLSLLRGYLLEISSDFSYVLIFIMMSVCLLVYIVYASLLEIQMLMEEKRFVYEMSEKD